MSCQVMGIPAYFYPNPTTLWDQAIAGAPTVNFMVVDPANGPGTTVDQNYVTVIARAKAAGIKLFGYVTSSYASRTAASIEAEIDAWSTMYGLTDIFVDEVTSDAANVPYYQTLYNYVKTKSSTSKVILNPGTTVDQGYMAASDIICVFEGTYADYLGFTFPAWVNTYTSDRFWHLVYACPDTASMNNAVTMSQNHNAGNVYVTDDVLTQTGFPWDTLPTYWSAELAAINACMAPPPPNVIQNGTFDTTLTPWTFTVDPGAAGSVTTTTTGGQNGTQYVKVTVTQSNTNAWYVQLGQDQFPLTAGHLYTLKFWAKASKSRTFNVAVQKGVSPYTYYLNSTVNLTTTWTQFTLTFTPSASEANALLTFNYAKATGSVSLDSVTLT